MGAKTFCKWCMIALKSNACTNKSSRYHTASLWFWASTLHEVRKYCRGIAGSKQQYQKLPKPLAHGTNHLRDGTRSQIYLPVPTVEVKGAKPAWLRNVIEDCWGHPQIVWGFSELHRCHCLHFLFLLSDATWGPTDETSLVALRSSSQAAKRSKCLLRWFIAAGTGGA